MQLSTNFTLEEMYASQTAVRDGIDNTPNEQVIARLKDLCDNVLQPLRNLLKQPIVISSGYRSPALNAAVHGVPNSEHQLGQAADITVPGMTNAGLAGFIIQNELKFNQLILEFYREDSPFYGWVHVSFCKENNKNEVLRTPDGATYMKGLPN
jgi:zinc D-Ala-D-Ala carboxypeptidase